MISREYLLALLLFVATAITLASCGGGGSGEGRLTLSLTDSPAADLQKVEIAIAEISAHRSDGEVILASYEEIPCVVDLLQYRYDGTPDSTYPLLSQTPIKPGHYQWIRMKIQWAKVTDSTGMHEVDVSNISNRGIRFGPAFRVKAGETMGLLLDLDVGQSFQPISTGSGRHMLHPVVRAVPTSVAACIKGQLKFHNPLGAVVDVPEDARIAAHLKDHMEPSATGLIETDGNFSIGPLTAGVYDLRVLADGYDDALVRLSDIAVAPCQVLETGTTVIEP